MSHYQLTINRSPIKMVESFEIFFQQVPLLSHVFRSVSESHALQMRYVPAQLQHEALLIRYKYNVDLRMDSWGPLVKSIKEWPDTVQAWFQLFDCRLPHMYSLTNKLVILMSVEGPIYALAAKFGKVPVHQYVPVVMYQLYIKNRPPLRTTSIDANYKCCLCWDNGVMITRCNHILCKECVTMIEHWCPVCNYNLNFNEYHIVTNEQHIFMARVMMAKNQYFRN